KRKRYSSTAKEKAAAFVHGPGDLCATGRGGSWVVRHRVPSFWVDFFGSEVTAVCCTVPLRSGGFGALLVSSASRRYRNCLLTAISAIIFEKDVLLPPETSLSTSC